MFFFRTHLGLSVFGLSGTHLYHQVPEESSSANVRCSIISARFSAASGWDLHCSELSPAIMMSRRLKIRTAEKILEHSIGSERSYCCHGTLRTAVHGKIFQIHTGVEAFSPANSPRTPVHISGWPKNSKSDTMEWVLTPIYPSKHPSLNEHVLPKAAWDRECRLTQNHSWCSPPGAENGDFSCWSTRDTGKTGSVYLA